MSGHLPKGADTGDELSQRKLFPKVNFPLCCLLMLKLGIFSVWSPAQSAITAPVLSRSI